MSRLKPGLRYEKFLSILSARFNRIEYNRAELDSLLQQTFPLEKLELIIIDESTDNKLESLLGEYSKYMDITYRHVSGWKNVDGVAVMPSGKVSISWHYNHALSFARGEIVLIETGEFLHQQDSIWSFVTPHLERPDLIISAQIRNLRNDILPWIAKTDVESYYASWVAHPIHTPLFDEMACASVRASNLCRIGGLDEYFMRGLSAEVGEVKRRLVRSGLDFVYSDNIVGHVEHEASDKTSESASYRAAQLNRRQLDSGYHDYTPRVKYCRPGSDLNPIYARHLFDGIPEGLVIT